MCLDWSLAVEGGVHPLGRLELLLSLILLHLLNLMGGGGQAGSSLCWRLLGELLLLPKLLLPKLLDLPLIFLLLLELKLRGHLLVMLWLL